MRSRNLDYDAALALVKSKRQIVKPNRGFVEQLKLWRDLQYDINEPEMVAGESQPSDGQIIPRPTNIERHQKEGYRQWKEAQRRKVLGLDA